METNHNDQTEDNRICRDNIANLDLRWNEEYGYIERMRVIFVK